MYPRVLVRQQRKRSNVAGPMASLAMLLKNPHDLIIKRDALRACFAAAKQKQGSQASSSNTHNEASYCTITAACERFWLFLFF